MNGSAEQATVAIRHLMLTKEWKCVYGVCLTLHVRQLERVDIEA